MATVHQEIPDREAFQEILNNNDDGIIIIKFGADWCQPCKLINPWLKNISLSYQLPLPSTILM